MSSFLYQSSIDLLDTTQKVTVTATGKSVYTYNAAEEYTDIKTEEYTLSFKNPCIDTAFAVITERGTSAEEYIISDPKADTQHAAFVLKTEPFDHTFCGDIIYSAIYNNGAPTAVTTTSEPFAYNPETRTFSIRSDDNENLKGEVEPYKIIGQLENWPIATYASATSDSVESTITYVNGCKVPLLTKTEITSPAADKYTDTANTVTVGPWTTTPSYCEVTYTCMGVSGPAGSALGCADLVGFTLDQTAYVITENSSFGLKAA